MASNDIEDVGLLAGGNDSEEDSTDNGDENGDAEDAAGKHCEDKYGRYCHWFFHFLCYISGQLMIDYRRNNLSCWMYFLKILFLVVSVFFFIIFLCLNLGSLVFDLYAIIKCPFPNCGFIAGPYIESKSFNAAIEYNISEQLGSSAAAGHSYFSYQDAVITVATVSGSFSYLIMMFRVLIINYSFFHRALRSCHTKVVAWIIEKLNFETITADEYKEQRREIAERPILNPFFHGKEDSEEFKPVFLHAKQLLCFYAIFFTNFLLYLGNVATLSVIVWREINVKIPKWDRIDYAGLFAQLASQYCAIISCFIFSKVAYAVTLKCDGQLQNYRNIISNVNHASERDVLRALEEEDTRYVQLCNDSMKPYRLWFSVHWFMYALAAFMSIAYFVDTLIDYKKTFQRDYLVVLYVLLFTLEHTVLFMYPCFRAATILEARNTLIHKVSLQPWEPSVKSRFLQFMKEQRCGFVLSLVCVRLEFGFNVAYLSIFFGFIGIVIKVFSLT